MTEIRPTGDEFGRLRRETIHRMTRRCLNWNYCGTGTYLITLVLNDRSRPILGRLSTSADLACSRIEPSELGRRVETHFLRLTEFSPEIEVLGVQLMPEHLHAVLRVNRPMAKPLGEHLRGFKIGASKIARELGEISPTGSGVCEAARGKGLFADGFVDTILGDEAAVEKGVAYMRDNPRRLAVKRAFPELFKVLGELVISLPIDGQAQSPASASPTQPVQLIGRNQSVCLPIHGQAYPARFAAIGNRALLDTPHIVQVQVSRRDFAYRRDAKGEIIRSAADGRGEVALSTPVFEEKAERLLAAAAHGAALISPCISEGEREIAARAFAAGHKVITLQNKGFSPLYKPGGKLFEQCAAGNLLLLAPFNWPYLPGKKPMTRLDACVLNRIAQLIAGDGAAEISYRGADPGDVDNQVKSATR